MQVCLWSLIYICLAEPSEWRHWLRKTEQLRGGVRSILWWYGGRICGGRCDREWACTLTHARSFLIMYSMARRAHLHVPQRGWANRAMAANAGSVAVAVQDKPGRTPLDLLKVRGELVGVGVPDGAGIYSAIGQNMAFYASSTPSSSFSGNPGFCWLWRRCCQCAAPKTGRNAGWLTPIEVLGGGHSLKCAGSGSRRQ